MLKDSSGNKFSLTIPLSKEEKSLLCTLSIKYRIKSEELLRSLIFETGLLDVNPKEAEFTADKPSDGEKYRSKKYTGLSISNTGADMGNNHLSEP